jgi:putative acyl-CoA dehydrogenase
VIAEKGFPAVPTDFGATHEVANQVPPFEDVNLFETDRALAEALEREGGGAFRARVAAFGALVGSAHAQQLGRDANRHSPELRTHDRTGRRIDEVAFHPAWHEVMRLAMAASVHNLSWREPVPGATVARSALHQLLAEVEAGSCCPLTMTFACVPALRADEKVFAAWEPALLGTEYDPRLVPLVEKRSVTVGMAMTEKQGGSDVRANTTRAEPAGAPGEYRLVGHKWFCSAPMSDAFLTLAQTDEGLTCFLVPRVLPDGARNPFAIQRLKDKLGNRSNASARKGAACGRSSRWSTTRGSTA